MPLTGPKLRIILRWLHLIFGLVVLCYIYSPWHRFEGFQILVKFLIIPTITFSGIWLWKFKAFNKFFRIQ